LWSYALSALRPKFNRPADFETSTAARAAARRGTRLRRREGGQGGRRVNARLLAAGLPLSVRPSWLLLLLPASRRVLAGALWLGGC
jgi:hypothetical protein